MRRVIALALLMAQALPALAEDKPGGDDKLVGTWGMATLSKPAETKDFTGTGRITLEKDGKAIWREKGKPDAVGTWKADPSRTPMELDVTVTRDEKKGPETLKAIYKIDGNRLELVYSLEGWGKERPKASDSRKAILDLQRQKP